MVDLGQSRPFGTIQVSKAVSALSSLALAASLTDAQNHRTASAVTRLEGQRLAALPANEICKCCNLPFEGKGYIQYSLCANKEELAELGLGFALFFLVVKWLMGMLFVVLCVASFPNLVQNLNADRQREFGAKSQIAGTSVGGNGDIDSDLDYWPVVLNAIALFLLCILYVLLCVFAHRVAAKLNEGMNTPADYAVVFKNLGSNWTTAELKAHIKDNMTLHGTSVTIEEISTSYGTHEYIKQLNDIAELSIRYRRAEADKHVPMERPCRSCLCCFSRRSYMSNEEYQNKLDEYKNELIKLANTVTKTGIAFVSLKTQDQVNRFLNRWKGRGIKKYFSCFQGSTGKKFKGNTVRVKRAPEPSDIIWENLVYSRKSRVLRTLVTTVLLAGILCCSFFILYGLAQWQKDLYDNLGEGDKKSTTGEKKSSIEFSSIPPAIIIYVFNIALDKTVRLMSTFEHRHSYTDEILSVSWKLTIVSSLNTLLFPLLTHTDSSEWYTPGGLANNIFWVALSAAFVKPVFKVCYPYFIWRCYRRWDIKRVIKRQSAYISQGQANRIFQHCEIDVAACYADVMTKFLLCLAYTPLLPLIVPIILLGLGLEYWINKWVLLRQSCRPRFLNGKIAFSMVNFVKLALVLYGISILIFFPDINGDTRSVGIAAIIFAAAFWLCHFIASLFFKCFLKPTPDSEDYQSAFPKFSTVTLTQTYKIANPFTHFDGMTNRETSQIEKMNTALQEQWQQNYLANRFGLLSAVHTPIYSQYAALPLATQVIELGFIEPPQNHTQTEFPGDSLLLTKRL